MANTKSAMKRIRSSERRAQHNQVARSTARTYVKRARQLIEEGNLQEAQAVVAQAVSALDRAAKKGVIHRNNASRRKSRLMKLYNHAKGSA